MNRLTHLTLTTGHQIETDRADVWDSTISLLKPLVMRSRAPVPGPLPWWLIMEPAPKDGGWRRWHLSPNPDAPPYVSCTGCWEETASWTAWDQLKQPEASLPPPVPWLAVSLHPMIITLPPAVVIMLGDLERSIFWTLVAVAEGKHSP